MKNLYVLVHPDLSLEDLRIKHQELVSDGHDMIVLDYGDKHGAVFNWCHTNPPHVLGHHHVGAGDLDQSFGQCVQEYADRYDEIFPYHAEENSVPISSFERAEELIEKYDDNEDGQLSAEELEDVVEDLVEDVEEDVEEDVVEDLDEKNATDDSISDSDDSDGGTNSWMRHN